MAVADTLFVGWLGTTELAAIGIASIAAFACSAFGMGLLAGVKIVTAHRIGARQNDAANSLLWQGLWLCVAMGFVGVSLTPLVPTIFTFLNPNPQIQTLGSEYLSVRMLGLPIGFTVIALTQWYQGLGDMKTPMVANVAANGLNILLDPLFIFGWGEFPALGMAGAAWATVIAWSVAVIGLLLHSRQTLRRAAWRPNRSLLSEVIRMGLPLGVQRILGVLGFLLFSIVLGWCGEEHLAAHVLVMRIVSVSFLPGYAIGESASVLVGQAFGAARPKRAYEAWWTATWLAIVVMAICAALFIAIPGVFLQPFRPESSVLVLATQLMVIAGLFQVFDAVAMVGLCCLAGAGDTRFSMFTTVSCMWLINLPLAFFLAVELEMGAPGAWWAMTAEIAGIAALCLWRIYTGRWMGHQRRLQATAAK
jgi:MATE family multidrug resistance protein